MASLSVAVCIHSARSLEAVMDAPRSLIRVVRSAWPSRVKCRNVLLTHLGVHEHEGRSSGQIAAFALDQRFAENFGG